MGNSMPQGPTTPSEMKYCANCGKQILRVAEFCPHCGGRQIPPLHTDSSDVLGSLGNALRTAIGSRKVRYLFWFLMGFFALRGTVLFIGEWIEVGDFSRAIDYFDGFAMWLIPCAALGVGYIRWVYKTNRDRRKWIVFPVVAIAILCVLGNIGWKVLSAAREREMALRRMQANAPTSCITELNGYYHCAQDRINSFGINDTLRRCTEQEVALAIPPGGSAMDAKPVCWSSQPPPPPSKPSAEITSQTSNSPDTEANPQMLWGMSKEQVSQIFHSGDNADVKLEDAGTDALVYRNDAATTSDHTWYYFKEGKLVETRQIQVDGYPTSWYDEMREKMAKKYGQPVPGTVPADLKPVRADIFGSPRSLIILNLSKNDDCPGDPCVSEIFLDRSQPSLAVR